MSAYEELKAQADALRRGKRYALALPIYEKAWEEHRDECDPWCGWAYGYCLYKEGQYQKALDISREVFRQDREMKPLKNLYAWCIYQTEVKKGGTEDEVRFMKAASAILSLCTQGDPYAPYTLTILKVLAHFSRPFKAETVLEWTARLDPALLSEKPFSFEDEGGATRELASPKEKYYALRSHALLETGAYEACETLCATALRSIQKFHHHNDLWLRRRIALSSWKMGRVQEALKTLKEILTVRAEWFIKKEIAEIHAEQGERDTALRYAVEAALDRGEWEMKVKLFDLLADLFKAGGEEEAARRHVAFAYKLRIAREWSIPGSLAERATAYGIVPEELEDEKAQYKGLKSLWEKVKFGQKPQMEGRISRILPNGKAGFIEAGDGQSYYFRLRSFEGRPERAAAGMGVRFFLEDGFDAKKNRPSQVAVSVKPIQEYLRSGDRREFSNGSLKISHTKARSHEEEIQD